MPVWLAIGCWFHSLIFTLLVIRMYQKEKFPFSVSLRNQRNLSKEAWAAANIKGVKMSLLALPISVKSIFLKIEDILFVLKMVSLLTSLIKIVFFWKNALILKDSSSFVQKKEIIFIITLNPFSTNVPLLFYFHSTSIKVEHWLKMG